MSSMYGEYRQDVTIVKIIPVVRSEKNSSEIWRFLYDKFYELSNLAIGVITPNISYTKKTDGRDFNQVILEFSIEDSYTGFITFVEEKLIPEVERIIKHAHLEFDDDISVEYLYTLKSNAKFESKLKEKAERIKDWVKKDKKSGYLGTTTSIDTFKRISKLFNLQGTIKEPQVEHTN